MNKTNLVSIVIPVYNSSKYIEDTIKSIENQTYKNYEAIFIDDYSKDDSINIIEKYQKINSKIKIIKLNKHKGVAFARNIGIRKSTGNYLTFLDSDDIWTKYKLEKQIGFIKDKEFIYSAFRFMNNDGTMVSKKIEVPLKIDYQKSLLNNRILTATAMINLNKIPKRYCYMPNVMNEDIATWWKILKKGYIAYAQNEVLAYYRKHSNSRSSNKLMNATHRWKTYRKVEKLSIFKSCYCFIHYVINAVKKRTGQYLPKIDDNLEVLISTQNLENEKQVNKLVKEMNISSKFLIINQNDKGIKINNKNVITKNEKGLSKSRNSAIKSSREDIILFSDDDVKYELNYESIILEAYQDNPKANVICFYVESKNPKRKTKKLHKKKIGYLNAMKIVSFEISCKKEFLLKNNLMFNEDFGSGATYNRGEEQILLYEMLRKKIRPIFINKKIGEAEQRSSTWLKKYDKEFFKIQGKVFKKMSPKYYIFLILQFAVRKYFLYQKDISFWKALKAMINGAREIKI